MATHRIAAILIRHLFLFRRSFDRLSEILYWPLVDVVLWGITSSFFQSFLRKSNGPESALEVVFMIMMGICFWVIVWRSQYDFAISLLEELWNKNMVNLFGTPLTFSEWVLALLMLGFLKVTTSFLFAALLAYALYSFGIFTFGFALLPMVALLFMSGWWMGFLVAGLILRYGTRVQALAWTLGMVLAPFMAIYYPLEVLPQWVQKISLLLPGTYIFESGRQAIVSGTVNWNYVFVSLLLNLLYFTAALLYLHSGFKKVLKKGLVKLY